MRLGPGQVQVVNEASGHAPVDQAHRDGHDAETDHGDQQLPGRPVKDPIDERSLLPLGLAGLARGDLEGTERQRPGHRGLA
jgi:hypothetical protein